MHVAATNDITGSQTIYVNGVADATGTLSRATSDAPVPITIGGRSLVEDSEDQFFDGQIDDVRIYNRVLSAAEVRYLYNRGGPVAHYKFEEGSGTTAFDSAGSNDGTLTNMADSDWVVGKFGTALDFDGTDDHIIVSDDASISGLAALTVSAWIKPDAWPTTTCGTGTDDCFKLVVSKANWASQREYRFQQDGPNSELDWFVSGDGGSGGNSSTVSIPVSDVPAGEWHYITGTWDTTTSEQIFFVDGDRKTSTTFATSTLFDGTANLGQAGTNTTWFTVTGEVLILAISSFCSVDLTEAAPTATISLGVTGATGLFIAAINAVDIDANEFWVDATPVANGFALPAACKDILITDDILSAAAVQNVTGGTLRVDTWWIPMSPNGLLVPAV